jgi:hypothetical protein
MKRRLMLVFTLLLLSIFNSSLVAQTKTREQLLDEITASRNELQGLEQQFLAVSESDRAAYANLLAEPDTGIFRLLPREKFDSETYKKNEKTITMKGGGAYYSFSTKAHDYNSNPDISLDHDQLSAGFAGLDYGMLAKIDGISLRELSAEHPYVTSIIKYEPPSNEPAIRNEQRRFAMGTVIDDVSLKHSVPAEPNTTYLLRSISYSRSDILVGLRVVRRDTDGSLIIAWKLLKNFTTPQVAKHMAAQ